MNGNSSIKSLFDSPNIVALSRTSIFNNSPGNSGVLYIKNASKKSTTNEGDRTSSKKFSPLKHLTDLADNIKERKELRGQIKNFLHDRGITITKEIRSALPNTFHLGNSIELRSVLKEKLSGHEFIQMEFLSLMISHINKGNFSDLLKSSNIFSADPNIMNEINSILKSEMSDQAVTVANNVFEAASGARANYLKKNTNSDYGVPMSKLSSEANNAAFKEASSKLADDFSKIKCSSNFLGLTSALATSLDKAIEMTKPKSDSIDQNQISELKEKIIDGLLLSSFTKFLRDEVKIRSKSFSGRNPFESLVLLLENFIGGRKANLSQGDIQPQNNEKIKFKSQDILKNEMEISIHFKFPASFEEILDP